MTGVGKTPRETGESGRADHWHPRIVLVADWGHASEPAESRGQVVRNEQVEIYDGRTYTTPDGVSRSSHTGFTGIVRQGIEALGPFFNRTTGDAVVFEQLDAVLDRLQDFTKSKG